MAENNIKISVIVPVYGVEKYLKECVDSILNQTFKDFEILLIDDGSKDKCSEMIDEYAKIDDRIVPIHKQNGGYGNTMNLGLSKAKGDYISIIEPDDYVKPEMFNDLYKIIVENDCDIVKSCFNERYDIPDYQLTKIVSWNKRHKLPNEIFTIKDCPLFLYFHPSIWTCLYKREFLVKNNIKFVEAKGAGWTDNPFQVQTLLLAKKIAYCPNTYYYWRKTNKDESKDLKDWTIPFKRSDEIHKWLDENNVNDKDILACLSKRELAYIFLVIDSLKLNGLTDEVKTSIYNMIDRMNLDYIKSSKFLTSKEKRNLFLFRNFLDLFFYIRKLKKIRQRYFAMSFNLSEVSIKLFGKYYALYNRKELE